MDKTLSLFAPDNGEILVNWDNVAAVLNVDLNDKKGGEPKWGSKLLLTNGLTLIVRENTDKVFEKILDRNIVYRDELETLVKTLRDYADELLYCLR